MNDKEEKSDEEVSPTTARSSFLHRLMDVLPIVCKHTYSGRLIIKLCGMPIYNGWSLESERLINRSSLFNEQYYVAHAKREMRGLSPAKHYIKYGRKDNVNPGPFFYNDFYLSLHARGGRRRDCPLLHYEYSKQRGVTGLQSSYSEDEFERQNQIVYDVDVIETLRRKGRPVLLVSHELSRTGAPVALLELAKRMQTMGLAPMVLSPLHGPLEADFEAQGIPCRVSYLVKASMQNPCDEDPLNAFASRFDMIVLSTMVAAEWASRFKVRGVKLVLWAHEGLYYLRHIRSAGDKKRIVSCLSCFDLVLCGGAYAASIVAEIADGKILPKILLYGVPDYAVAERSARDDTGRIQCVIAGTVDERKAQDVLVSALKLLSSKERSLLDVVIVGKSSSKRIEKLIASSGLGCIRRIQEMSLDGLINLIAGSDALLCPSRDDPMPIVATYAMMFSKLVLVSDHTGTAALIEDGVSGFVVKAGSEESLAVGIRRMIDSRLSRPEIGRRARAIYEKNFTIESFDKAIKGFLL